MQLGKLGNVACGSAFAYAAFLIVAMSMPASAPQGPEGAFIRVPYCAKENNTFAHKCRYPEITALDESVMSKVTVLEDGVPIGPRSSLEDIRKYGSGRYTLSKENSLVISPRDNGASSKHNYWLVLR